MIVTITSCADSKTGKPKNERIIGEKRDLALILNQAILKYLDGSGKARTTSRVENVVVVNDKITIHTQNTIYKLTVVGAETSED
jgi:hypothetical protein